MVYVTHIEPKNCNNSIGRFQSFYGMRMSVIHMGRSKMAKNILTHKFIIWRMCIQILIIANTRNNRYDTHIEPKNCNNSIYMIHT